MRLSMKPTITSAVPLIAALLAACTPEPPQECAPADAPWVDFDQDGFPASVDCNDSDPTIHPGAFELCDNIDNNCNGLIDEGYPLTDEGFADCDPVEICDGVDNNYNGLIDEGFQDFDGDGIADCLDDHCELFLDLSSREVAVDPDCTEGVIEVPDPWNVRVKWQWRDGSSTSGSYTTPVIGRFLDTNGDGVVDFADIPIVATTMNFGQKVVGLRGDTGELVYEVGGVSGAGSVLLVDADGDGEVEAVVFDNGRRLMALDRFGEVKWRASQAEMANFPHAVVADVDGDGIPEFITQSMMFSGLDGSLITNFGMPPGIPTFVPTVGDIDLDGEQEIFIGRNVYRPDGTIKWSHDIAGNAGHWAAIVNMDDDPEGELLVVGTGRVGMYEHDGTLIRIIETESAARPGPICVADFDGDGEVEMAWASRGLLAAMKLDGTVIWSVPINDFSGLVAGCAGFDVDGDRQYEIMHADIDVFRIWNGATGVPFFELGGHRSATILEYPTVADVDGDGSAEVVIVSNGHSAGWGSITVFEHADNAWPPSGETWPIHDFAVTNINPDGTVPDVPTPSWQVHNTYRARPFADTVAANLQGEITDACVSGCTDGVGIVKLAVEVINNGASDVYIDIPVTVFAKDGSAEVPLATQWLRGGVGGGSRRGGLEFEFPIEALTTDGFIVRVDDRGRGIGNVVECSEDDNQTTWPYPVCD